MLRIAAAVAVFVLSTGLALAQTSGSTAAANPPTIPSQSPAAHDPGVNPSAAGIQAGDVGSTGGVRKSVKGGREHSGSQRLSANTHPFAAAKANHQRRWKQREQQVLQHAIGSSGQTQNNSGVAAGR